MTTVAQISPLELYKKIYKYNSALDSIKAEADEGYMMTELEINDGVYAHFQGMEYPERGLVKMEDIWATNIVKRLVVHTIKLLPLLAPTVIVFVFLPYFLKRKILNRVLKAFNDVAMKVMRPSLLQFRHMTPMAQELQRGLQAGLIDLGIEENTSNEFAEIFSNIINFDNAYRYRIQDLANETTMFKLFSKPQRELWRLRKLHEPRERIDYKLENVPDMKDTRLGYQTYIQSGDKYSVINSPIIRKVRYFYGVAHIMLLHPRIKRAYRNALLVVDWSRILPDDMDRFWMCLRGGYNYFGKTKHERYMMINHLKVCKPIKLSKL